MDGDEGGDVESKTRMSYSRQVAADVSFIEPTVLLPSLLNIIGVVV